MRCSQAREALSAWYDGERADADPSAVAGHLASCQRCTAFQGALGAVADLADDPIRPPDLAPVVLERRESPVALLRALRIAIALAGLASLLPALSEMLGHTDHEVHESLAFTLAVSVSLLCAAARPRLAPGYLPVIGAVSLLLVVTSAIDVDEGRVGATHELRHLGVLVGFGLVAMMARRGCADGRDDPPGRLTSVRARRQPTSRRSAVRLLGRSAAPALGGTLLAALVLLIGPPASAHAMLERSTPAADAVLQDPPTSVSLVFNEDVTLLPDSVRVFGPDGKQVDDGSVERAQGDSATAEVGLPSNLPDGTFLVSYRVVSADSHPVEGAYTFVVGHPSRAAPAAVPTDSGGSRSVDVALGFSRWLSYAGSALGLGGFAFLVWCWPAGWASRRARLLVGGGAGVLAVGTLLALFLKGPYDAGLGLGSVTDGALLREVLGTTYGRALDVRLFLIAALVLLLTYRDHVPARWLKPMPAVLLAGAGVTFALGGHAAAGGHRTYAIVSDTAHVAAMSIWLGGLVLLVGAVLVRGAGDDAMSPVLRFSTLASGAVTLLIATGIYQTLREVRSYDVLLHSHYGHVLLVKLGIVALAFFAAAGSRAWVWQAMNPVVPVHAATAAPPEPVVDRRPPLRRLRTSVGLETTMLVGVLVATAMLVTSDPAVSSTPPHPVSANLTVGPDHVQVSATPDGPQRVQLMLQVTDAAGKPTEPKEVDASLRLDASKIGPLPVTLTRMGRGGRMGHVSVPVAGDWQLAVTVRTTAIDEATAYVDVPIG